MAGGARGNNQVREVTLRGAYLVEAADGTYLGVVWKRGRIWHHHRFTESIAGPPRQGTANREDAIREIVGE